MIQLFFDGETISQNRNIKNLRELSDLLLKNRKELDKIKIEEIIELIHLFSQNILTNPETRGIEGIAFLSQWLKKSNLKKILEINFEDPRILEDYVEKKDKLIIAQPKGLVGHWIAGNVIILGIFSLVQSILVRNANIMRVPLGSVSTILKLIEIFGKTKVGSLEGAQLISSTALIYYPKEEKESNEEFSNLCDARIIWGGKEAVTAISNTEKKETCEDIIFGPKYSFSIIDKKTIENPIELRKNMEKLVYDIIFSEQNSCTSPQTLICEGNFGDLKKVASEIKNRLENLPKKYNKKEITLFEASNILRIRGEYAAEGDRDVIKSKGSEWTILMDKEFRLEEPIKSRTIFLKSCNNLNEIKKLITPKIQTVGYAMQDKNCLLKLSKELNLKGVFRIVPFGQMNYYDTPWDGKLLLTRLVNFNSLKLSLNMK